MGNNTLKSGLDELLNTHLYNNKIWENNFFKVMDDKNSDPEAVWQMLVTWAENMMHASYGFQTYVLTLASRAENEKIRRLLVENAWEELGDYEYPQRSHFQMICNLSRICGIDEQYINSPRLLPTSRKHVSGHIQHCRESDLLFGLGMMFLIENLTKLEFEKVLRGFIRYWEFGTGKKLEEFALGNGVSYFSSNIEADGGHAEDVEEILYTYIEEMGISQDEALAIIGAGMEASINFRNGFVQGVYDAVFANVKEYEAA